MRWWGGGGVGVGGGGADEGAGVDDLGEVNEADMNIPLSSVSSWSSSTDNIDKWCQMHMSVPWRSQKLSFERESTPATALVTVMQSVSSSRLSSEFVSTSLSARGTCPL
ncbi:hypothetical protein F2Q68_00001620 [Brassica cretica]|uniref:Uncharacterized protein n=1 Tax=Brassica cretica TaxID=69181 RepID=A0A8S9JJY0_BRACR|nr:hypothetical protein F2Q68_00001620 [Brassica cretica]